MAIIRLQCCRRCKHSESLPSTSEHECRRYPPTVAPLLVPQPGGQPSGYTIHMQTCFPRVPGDAFCSEWARRLASAGSGLAPDDPALIARDAGA